jgi:hypothetical protein
LLQAREEELVARTDAIRRDAADSTEALAQWLDALVQWATAFDGWPEPLREALGYVRITDEFLAAAQRDGGARPEVRGRVLFLASLAISWVRGAAMADESSRSGLRPAAHRMGQLDPSSGPAQDAERSSRRPAGWLGGDLCPTGRNSDEPCTFRGEKVR